MEFIKTKNGYFATLAIDEKLIETLASFAKKEKIPSGFIWGLGALKNAELGFYHLHKKAYDRKVFPAEAELVSLVGNIAWFEEEPVIHIHVALGAEDFSLYGGHLFEAQLAVTTEIWIDCCDVRIERKPNERVGLNLLHCRLK